MFVQAEAGLSAACVLTHSHSTRSFGTGGNTFMRRTPCPAPGLNSQNRSPPKRTAVGLSHHEPMPDSVDRHSYSFDSDVRIRTSCLILATSGPVYAGLHMRSASTSRPRKRRSLYLGSVRIVGIPDKGPRNDASRCSLRVARDPPGASQTGPGTSVGLPNFGSAGLPYPL